MKGQTSIFRAQRKEAGSAERHLYCHSMLPVCLVLSLALLCWVAQYKLLQTVFFFYSVLVMSFTQVS